MYDAIDPFPEPADFAPGAEMPAVETEAERKRRERQERKDAGLPDPRVVDSAIINAFAEVCAKGDAPGFIVRRQSTDKVVVFLRPVVEGALRTLVKDRGVRKDIAVDLVLKRLRLG